MSVVGSIAELGREWARQLGEWAIPDEILRAAPESPWGFPTGLFARAAESALAARDRDEPMGPSRRRALEALPEGGTVLDVGCGAGAASLPLAPPAARIVAVDESGSMLESLARLAGDRVEVVPVAGRWPDVAGEVERADVVVCHHVVYNVADVVPFLTELDLHARRRVVIELTEMHPQSDLNPLWRALHGIERPAGPAAADLVELVRAMGHGVQVERSEGPDRWALGDRATQVAFARKRLCVGPERDGEIDRLLVEPVRRLVTVWWDPTR
jgi:SAM-dependent methyltransferase